MIFCFLKFVLTPDKVKVSLLGDVKAWMHIYTAMALGRCRVASPIVDHLYPRENPSTHFTGG